MKKCILGIGVLLFAIVFNLSSTGIELIPLTIGIIGLVIVIWGYISESE